MHNKRSITLVTISAIIFCLAAPWSCEEPDESIDIVSNSSTGQNDTDPTTNETDEQDPSDSTDTSFEEPGTADTTDGFQEKDTNDTSISGVCSEQDFNIEFSPVRLMILLDHSGSMGYLQGENEPSYMMEAKSALLSVLDAGTGADIEFGFNTFPSDPENNACGVGDPVRVDAAPGNLDTIRQAVQNLPDEFSAGSTPLCTGMQMFTRANYAPSFKSKDATSYLLVVADGGDNCGGTAPCSLTGMFPPPNFAKLTQNLLAIHGIRTFVIGFGESGLFDFLNAIARNGGTGLKKYIHAANKAELQSALDTIVAATVSCVFDLNTPDDSADPDKINFYFDDVVVGKDDDCSQAKGWTWTDDTHTKVRFCDESCQQLQDGSIDVISAKFGCPVKVVI